MTVFPKLVCKFNVTPFKTKTSFFKGLDKLNLNVYWRETDKAQPHHVYRRTKWRNLTLPDTKTKYRCIIIRTQWCWDRTRKNHQKTRRESLSRDPHIPGLLMYEKDSMIIPRERRDHSIHETEKCGSPCVKIEIGPPGHHSQKSTVGLPLWAWDRKRFFCA